MLALAEKKKLCHATNHNLRYYPVRAAGARHDRQRRPRRHPRRTGHLFAGLASVRTDFNWRITRKGQRPAARHGRHRLALDGHDPARHRTLHHRPLRRSEDHPQDPQTAQSRRRDLRRQDAETRAITTKSRSTPRTSAWPCIHLGDTCRGAYTVSQVTAGCKNRFEVAHRRNQGQPVLEPGTSRRTLGRQPQRAQPVASSRTAVADLPEGRSPTPITPAATPKATTTATSSSTSASGAASPTQPADRVPDLRRRPARHATARSRHRVQQEARLGEVRPGSRQEVVRPQSRRWITPAPPIHPCRIDHADKRPARRARASARTACAAWNAVLPALWPASAGSPRPESR